MGVLTLHTCSGDLLVLFYLNKICNTFGFPLLIEVEKYGEQTCKMWSLWSVSLNTTHCSSSLISFHSSLTIFQNKFLVLISVYVLLLCLFYFCWHSLFFNDLFKLIVMCSLVPWLLCSVCLQSCLLKGSKFYFTHSWKHLSTKTPNPFSLLYKIQAALVDHRSSCQLCLWQCYSGSSSGTVCHMSAACKEALIQPQLLDLFSALIS